MTTSSNNYNTLMNSLTLIFQNFTAYFAAPQCQYYTSGSAFPAIDYNCINTFAATTCGNLIGSVGGTAAIQATNASVYALLECGTSPTYPNGACYDTSFQAFAAANATLVAQAACSTPSTNTQASTGSSGGGGGIGLAAGAAGGGAAILIIIIVILVMRRRKRTNPQTYKKSEDRTVVAFENPMYDDPGVSGGQTAIYDNKAHDSEGLYDEPAFNNTNKHNPVYQSNEDLAASGEGYLENPDAPRGGDGYLDVSPGAAPAEDVGYLEGKNAPQQDSEYAAAE